MLKTFKIAFFGTTDFAVETLDLIKDHYNVGAVVTSQDKPAGRGLKIRESAVKIYAKKNQLKTLQPVNLKSISFEKELIKLNCDMYVVVAFRMLPKSIWSIPKLGTINLHASLLPNYRGAAPINWAIINGETKTGVSTFFINENIDTGDIIDQSEVEIDKHENAGDLYNKLKKIGATLVINTIGIIISNDIILKPQIELSEPSSANKLTKENCTLNWTSNSINIYNKIRGLSPYPGATSTLNHFNQNLKVIFYSSSIEIVPHDLKFGEIIIEKKQIKVATKDGFIIPLELKIQGKKRMRISDLINGFKFNVNSRFIS